METGTRFWKVALGVAALGLLGGASAQALTIATFADPTVGTSPVVPMFTVNNGTIAGGWTGLGLDLAVGGLPGLPGTQVYQDVILEFPTLTYLGSFTAGSVNAASLHFYERDITQPGNKGQEVLKIDFTSADLSKQSFGSDNVFSNNGVAFSYLGTPVSYTEESFAFSFANQVKILTQGQATGFTATAAFTSSAVVPEPVSLVFLGLGVPLLAIRRRH